MFNYNVAIVILLYELCNFFCTINGAMLASGAAKIDCKTCEMALQILLNRLSHKVFSIVKKTRNRLFLFEEINYRLVLTRISTILLIAARIGQGSAVEHKSAPISTRVVGYSTLVAEAAYPNREALAGLWCSFLAKHLLLVGNCLPYLRKVW